MLNDAEVRRYLFQPRHLGTLEGMIREFHGQFTPRPSLKPITTAEQAVQLRDYFVFPAFERLYEIKSCGTEKPGVSGVKRPEVSVVGNSLREDALSLARASTGYLAGGAVHGYLLRRIGARRPEVLLAMVLPAAANIAFGMYRARRSDGWVNYLSPGRCYIKSSPEDNFAHSLAHECAHSIQSQHMPLLYRLKKSAGEFRMAVEGLAEKVAVDACRSEPRYRAVVTACAFGHLTVAYRYLCEYFNRRLPGDLPVKFPQGWDSLLLRPYHQGFSAMELLSREHGSEFISDVLRNRPVRIS